MLIAEYPNKVKVEQVNYKDFQVTVDGQPVLTRDLPDCDANLIWATCDAKDISDGLTRNALIIRNGRVCVS